MLKTAFWLVKSYQPNVVYWCTCSHKICNGIGSELIYQFVEIVWELDESFLLKVEQWKDLAESESKEAHVHAESSSTPFTHTLTHYTHTSSPSTHTLPRSMYTSLFLPPPGRKEQGGVTHANLSFYSSHDPRSNMVKLTTFPEFTHPVPDHLWYANHSYSTIQWEWSAWQPLASYNGPFPWLVGQSQEFCSCKWSEIYSKQQ